MKKYQSTKTYGHEVGLSAAFRQWKADSHCAFLHGYSISVKFVFEATSLDSRNWVVDFGSLKSLKGILQDNFDHKTIVSEDDPEIEWFKEAHNRKILDLVIFPKCGCEAFAEYIHSVADIWLTDNGYSTRVSLYSVEVSEHGGNSALYIEDKP